MLGVSKGSNPMWDVVLDPRLDTRLDGKLKPCREGKF